MIWFLKVLYLPIISVIKSKQNNYGSVIKRSVDSVKQKRGLTNLNILTNPNIQTLLTVNSVHKAQTKKK